MRDFIVYLAALGQAIFALSAAGGTQVTEDHVRANVRIDRDATLLKALADVMRAADADDIGTVATRVASIEASLGQFESARRWAEGIDDASLRQVAIMAIAYEYARQGELKTAIELVSRTPPLNGVDGFLQNVVRFRVQQRKFGCAAKVSAQITSLELRLASLVEVVEGAAAVGAFETSSCIATRIIATRSFHQLKGDSRELMIIAHAYSGHVNEAKRALGQMLRERHLDSADERDLLLKRVAVGHASAKNFSQAVSTLEKIGDVYEADLAYYEVGVTQLRHGDDDGVTAMIERHRTLESVWSENLLVDLVKRKCALEADGQAALVIEMIRSDDRRCVAFLELARLRRQGGHRVGGLSAINSAQEAAETMSEGPKKARCLAHIARARWMADDRIGARNNIRAAAKVARYVGGDEETRFYRDHMNDIVSTSLLLHEETAAKDALDLWLTSFRRNLAEGRVLHGLLSDSVERELSAIAAWHVEVGDWEAALKISEMAGSDGVYLLIAEVLGEEKFETGLNWARRVPTEMRVAVTVAVIYGATVPVEWRRVARP